MASDGIEKDEPILTILFGTETGNAEDVAYRIADLAHRYHVPTRICNMDDYDRVRIVTPTGTDDRPS